MRFVDNTTVDELLDAAWHERAENALDEVRTVADDSEERGGVFKKYADVWKTAGKALGAIMDHRCWYCDVRQVRSDMPVDHFRPKNRVAEECVEEDDEVSGKKTKRWTHPGYWWRAFDWQNFRYSCTYCNSRRVDVEGCTDGGKQDHFPLLDGSPRAMCETDDHDAEQCVLLDPCQDDDPNLLTFGQDGQPAPSRPVDIDPIANKRAKRSIHLYHLHHAELVRERKRLWKKVDDLIGRGMRYETQGQPLDDIKHDLHGLIRRNVPLSRVAHLAVRGRRDIDWVREWLEEVETTL